ncbi:MAG: peptidoglycan DD-metalloendopeptidase family protein [Synergistaceae bacterium]|jgi:murein DD-endopeptidase MepM/ murein hydrolase activator NlpD|nr:peptidoglycan DD-metalloendopeptidase family protein [Synergistaceae bacterium]
MNGTAGHNKTLFRILAALVFLLASGVFFAGEGWGAPAGADVDAEIAMRERERNELDKKIQQYNETAKKKAQQAQSLLGRLTNLQQDSRMAQQQIQVLKLKSDKLQKSMGDLNDEMATTSRQVNSLVIELRARLINMYKYGSREELNLLLSAENTHEALASAYMLNRLSRYDQVVIDDLLNRVSELEQSRRNLEKSRTQLAEQGKELTVQQEKYDSSISETNALLTDARRERQKAEQAVKEIEQAQIEVGRTIMALMTKKRLREESPRPSRSSSNGAPPVEKENYTYLARGSLLDWPIKGSIAGAYGSRVHPVFKTKSFNSGIDIRAAANAPVKAAGPGEVLYEGWLRGFGQVVIIDHGNNISTVYAHMASTKVKEGTAVKAGTVVGTVGNSGTADDYSLHFEVRVGDAAKNPLDYLKKA